MCHAKNGVQNNKNFNIKTGLAMGALSLVLCKGFDDQ